MFRDRQTFEMTMDDWEIESANAWNLFYPYDNASNTWGGQNINARHINYTQGVPGLASWPCSNEPGGSSNHIVVRGSNLPTSIQSSGSGCRGYWFENITDNVDLTNASQGGTVLFNIFGTVTDPNRAATFEVLNSGRTIKLKPYSTDVFDNNAAALAGGLTADMIYVGSDNVLRIVR